MDLVTVTYNSREWLPRLLRSIEAQAPKAHVVVVDNASPDDTAALVPDWVQLIANPENRWLSTALNQGIALGSDDIVVAMNPDCELISPDWCERVEEYMALHPDVGIMGPRLVDLNGATQYSGHAFRTKRWALAQAIYWPAICAKFGIHQEWRWEPHWNRDTERELDVVSGAVMVIRRKVLEELGGFDEGYLLYWEESDLCRRAKGLGWKVVLWPGVEVMHAWAMSTRTADPDRLAAINEASFERYFTLHHGRAFGGAIRGVRRLANAARRVRHGLPGHQSG